MHLVLNNQTWERIEEYFGAFRECRSDRLQSRAKRLTRIHTARSFQQSQRSTFDVASEAKHSGNTVDRRCAFVLATPACLSCPGAPKARGGRYQCRRAGMAAVRTARRDAPDSKSIRH